MSEESVREFMKDQEYRIKTLESRLAEREAEIESLKEHRGVLEHFSNQTIAERDRYREALEKISAMTHTQKEGFDMKGVALAALEGTK